MFAPHILFHSDFNLIINNYYLSMSCQHFSLQALIEISAKHGNGANAVQLFLIELIHNKTTPTVTIIGLWHFVDFPSPTPFTNSFN